MYKKKKIYRQDSMTGLQNMIDELTVETYKFRAKRSCPQEFVSKVMAYLISDLI